MLGTRNPCAPGRGRAWAPFIAVPPQHAQSAPRRSARASAADMAASPSTSTTSQDGNGNGSRNNNANNSSTLQKQDFGKFVQFFRQASPYIVGHRCGQCPALGVAVIPLGPNFR